MSALSELRVLLTLWLYSPLFSSSSRGHLDASAGGPAVRVVATCHSVPVGRLAGPALGPRVQHKGPDKGQSWTCWTRFGNHVLTYGISLCLSLCRFVYKSGTQLLRTGPCAATRPPGQPWQSWPARRAEKTTAAGDRENERSPLLFSACSSIRATLGRARQ